MQGFYYLGFKIYLFNNVIIYTLNFSKLCKQYKWYEHGNTIHTMLSHSWEWNGKIVFPTGSGG